MSAFVVFCAVYFCVIILTNGQSCKETHDWINTMICTNLTKSFPIPKNSVESFKCINCNISILNEERILQKFVGEHFNLSDSHLQIIGENAFSKFTLYMQEFIFENNDIINIAPMVFSNFSRLSELNFRNNKISQLDARTFDGVTVTSLILSENNFLNIEHTFDGLTVANLNLSTNKIKDISKDCFAKTIFTESGKYNVYQYLDLSNNQIKNIHPGTYTCNREDKCILILYLNKNVITGVESNTFLGLTYLKILYLSDNLISHLESNSFNGLSNLIELYLQNNRIKRLPVSLFGNFDNLNVLDLSQNVISLLEVNTFSGLRYLENLNISYNNLPMFNYSHIFPLGQISHLDISDIKLHELNLNPILNHNFVLKWLVLNDNFWECSKLVELYGVMNKKFEGFNNPTRHFNVPNLHGIACSRKKLESYKDLTFQDFLRIISEDGISDEWLNELSITEERNTVKAVDALNRDLNSISNIQTLVIVFLVILILILTYFIFKLVIKYLHSHDVIKTSKFNFL